MQNHLDPGVASDRVRLIPRAPVKSLVMWSGGLDSTYTLARLLRETDDQVFAHHVHYNVRRPSGDGRSCRCEYEAGAIARLLPMIRDCYRQFDYAESRLDVTAFSQFARDETTVMFFAAQAALSHGLTPFDRILLGVNASDDTEWRAGTHACALRSLLAAQMLKTVWESEQVPFIYLWDPRPSKQVEAQYLPREVYETTVSCRDPNARERGFADTYFLPCTRCAPCRARAEVERRDAADGGPEADGPAIGGSTIGGSAAGGPSQSRRSSTYTAPVPPSTSRAEQNASTRG